MLNICGSVTYANEKKWLKSHILPSILTLTAERVVATLQFYNLEVILLLHNLTRRQFSHLAGKVSPVSPLTKEPTCILPFIRAKARRDQEFLIPTLWASAIMIDNAFSVTDSTFCDNTGTWVTPMAIQQIFAETIKLCKSYKLWRLLDCR